MINEWGRGLEKSSHKEGGQIKMRECHAKTMNKSLERSGDYVRARQSKQGEQQTGLSQFEAARRK